MMLTRNWLELTRKTKNYRVKARLGWSGWLPGIQVNISTSIWQFINDYWEHFKDMLLYEPYRINLDTASDVELAAFFLSTGLIIIEKISDDYQLTKNQWMYAMSVVRHYARDILEMIASGDVYQNEKY